MTKRTVPGKHLIRFCASTALLLLLSTQTRAATTVQVSTSLGNFAIELYDDIAPETVANFLEYVESGRFNRTVIHSSEPGIALRGGWLLFNPLNNTLLPITRESDKRVVNESRVSNSFGTIAMAKDPGDTNSSTSRWFINLGDNGESFDEQNGGFTVFGRIDDEGMTVVEKIAAQPTYEIAGLANFPLIDYYDDVVISANFIDVNMIVEREPPPPPNFLDEERGIMQTAIDTGTSGFAAISFKLIRAQPTLIFQLDLGSVEILSERVDKMASFNAAAGKLFMPELYVAGIPAFRNLTFRITDAENLIFELTTFEKLL